MRAFRTAASRVAGARFASVAAASAEAVKVSGIPAASVDKASQAYLTWTDLNVVMRNRAAAVVASDATTRFAEIRHSMKVPSAVKPIKETVPKAKTLLEVATALEAALYQTRVLEQERYDLQLHVWSLNDLINLGLSVSSAEKIEEYKKDLAATKLKLEKNRKTLAEYVAKHFDTETMNYAINAFRVAGETSPQARLYAETLLDDMSTNGIAFNEASKLLLKNVVFGDLPHEDSNLLFTFVENPERGEVSLARIENGDLSKVADDALYTIGQRHTTPVTEHTKLQAPDTHPMLQRSPE